MKNEQKKTSTFSFYSWTATTTESVLLQHDDTLGLLKNCIVTQGYSTSYYTM